MIEAVYVALVLILGDTLRVKTVSAYYGVPIKSWYMALNVTAYWSLLTFVLLTWGVHWFLVIVIGFVLSQVLNIISGILVAVARS